MGENEQGGQLRIVIVLSIIFLVFLVVIKAIHAQYISTQFTSLTSAVKLPNVNVVGNTSYIDALDKLSEKKWNTSANYRANNGNRFTGSLYSNDELSILKDYDTAKNLLSGPTGYLIYLTSGQNFEGDEGYEKAKVKTIGVHNSPYLDVPESKQVTKRWNISSVKLSDGREFTFDLDTVDHTSIYQNNHNLEIMKQIFGVGSMLNADISAKAYLDSITYANGLTVHKGDSMFLPYRCIPGSNIVAPYTPDGLFNTNIITSGLQKKLYKDNSLEQIVFAADLRLYLSPTTNVVNYGYTKYYQFYDKKSFNKLQHDHPTEWSKLI